jgi:hypothetical protein
MYKWPSSCSELRYRASAIPTTGTLAPVRDYSVGVDKIPVAIDPTQNLPGQEPVKLKVQVMTCHRVEMFVGRIVTRTKCAGQTVTMTKTASGQNMNFLKQAQCSGLPVTDITDSIDSSPLS